MEKLLRGRNMSAANFPTCETHPGKEMEMYCKGCEVAVCTMCFIKSHKNHYGSDVEEVSVDLRQQASSDASKVSGNLKNTGEFIRGFEKEKNDLTSQLAEVKSEINEAADKLIDAIQRDRNKLLSEVDTIRQKRFKELETIRQELEQYMAALESFKRENDTLISGTACDAVRSAKSLHDRADELTKFDITGHATHSLSRLAFKFASATEERDTRNLLGVISPGWLISCLLVLYQSLSSAREMSVYVDAGLKWPYSLCYDEFRRRLYVGERIGDRVIVIDNLKDFNASSI